MSELEALDIVKTLNIKPITKKGKVKDISAIMMEFRSKNKADNNLCKEFYEAMCEYLKVTKKQ